VSNSLRKNSPQQATEPNFRRNSSEDWALWRLSLILREIAEKLASPAQKEEPPSQAPGEDTLTGGAEEDDSHESG